MLLAGSADAQVRMWGARAAPGATAREVAENFVRQNATALGMRPDGSDRREVLRSSSRVGERVWFQQMEAGLPVLDRIGVLSVDPRLRVQAASSRFGSLSKVAGLSGAVTPGEAIRLAREATGTTGATRSPPEALKAIHAEGDSGLVVWKVLLTSRRPMADWEVLVDAEDRRVVRVRNLIKAATGTGRVFDPNPIVTTGSRAFTDGGDAHSTAYNAAYKTVSLPRLDGSGFLRGQWVDVHTQPGESGRNPGTLTRAFEPSLAFNYFRNDDRFEETCVYYHIDALQEYIQRVTGVSAANNRVTTVNAHEGDFLNAFYSPGTKQLYFGDGSNSPDLAEDADVIVHEYGHAVQDNQVPGWGQTSEGGAMGEGFSDFLADVWSSTRIVNSGRTDPDPACMGEWAFFGFSTCLRRTDGTKRYPQDIVGEVHDDGEIWAAALNGMRGQLGNEIALRLVLESHFLLDPFANFYAGANAILAADQAIHGGEHVSTIRAIFAARGILDPVTFPAVTSVTPEDVDNSAARSLTIGGSNFTGATAVRLIGPSTVTLAVTQLSATQIVATIPAGVSPGLHRVAVTIPAGTNTQGPSVRVQNPDDHPAACELIGEGDRIAPGGAPVTASIEVSGDRDLFSVAIPSAGTYRFGVLSTGLTDPYLILLDQDCSRTLAVDDDSGPGLSSRLEYSFTSAGTYFARVKDFSTGTGAYRLVAGSGAPALRVEALSASWHKTAIGQSVIGRATVRNSGGSAASITRAEPILANGNLTAPGVAASISLEAGAAATFAFSITGLAHGASALSGARFDATDPIDNSTLAAAENAAASASIEVVPAAPELVVRSIAVSRGDVAVGQTLSATVTVRNEGTAAASLTGARLVFSGSQLTAAALSASLSVAPQGGEVQLPFTATGASRGLGLITSATLDGHPVVRNDASAQSVVVGDPLPAVRILSIALGRTRTTSGRSFAGTVLLRNDGTAAANVTGASLVISGGALTSAPFSGALTLPAYGGTGQVPFTLTGSSAGTSTVSSMTMSATNASMPTQAAGIVANAASPASVLVQLAPQLRVDAIRAEGSIVSRGQKGARIELSIANGAAAATGAAVGQLVANARINALSSGFSISRQTVLPDTLAAGQSLTVTYSVEVLPTAPLGVSTIAPDVSGRDANTGDLLSVAGASATTQWTVRDAAALRVDSVTLPGSVVLRGETGLEVKVALTNTSPASTGNSAVSLGGGLRFNGAGAGYAVTPSPSNAASLAPGDSTTLSYSVAVLESALRGPIRVTAAPSALDAVSSQAVTIVNTASDTWSVEAPGELLVTSIAVPRASVSRGMGGLPVHVSARNSGDRAIALQTGLLVAGALDGYRVTTAPANAAALAGGQSAVLTFVVDVLPSAALGQVRITADAVAKEPVSGALARVTNSSSGAWTVQTPAALRVTSIAPPALAVVRGQRAILVQIGVTNPGDTTLGAAVEGLVAGLRFGGSSAGFTVSTAANASALAGGRSAVLTFTVDAGLAAPLGSVPVTVVATARDANSGLDASIQADVSASWTVKAPASLRVQSIALPAGHVVRGQTGLTVVAGISNTGESPASNVSVALRFNGSTSGFESTAAFQSSFRLLAGETKLCSFEVRPQAIGEWDVTAAASALDEVTALTASVTSTASARWTVSEPANVIVETLRPIPSRVTRGQSLQVELGLRNTGGTTATALAPSLTFDGQTSGFQVGSRTGALAAGASGLLTLPVSVLATAGLGDRTLRARVGWIDAVSAAAAATATSAAATLRVLSEAVLKAAAPVLPRAQVSRGQRALTVRAVARNEGQAAIEELSARLLFGGSAQGFAATAQAPSTLAAGASTSLTFAVDVLSTAPLGSTSVIVEVSGKDANTGDRLAAASPAAGWTVQRPAGLELRSIVAARRAIRPGESTVVTAIVRNGGEAGALIRSAALPAGPALRVPPATSGLELAGGTTAAIALIATAVATGVTPLTTLVLDASDANSGTVAGVEANLVNLPFSLAVGHGPAAAVRAPALVWLVDARPAVVTLDASGSSGAELPLTYAWRQTRGPAVSAGAEVTLRSSGDYAFELTVRDAIDLTSTATAAIAARANASPIVTLAAPEAALTLEPVRLEASATDPNGDALTYRWDQSAGLAILPTGPAATARATLPGSYVLRVSVLDGKGGTAEATASIEITAAPTAALRLGRGVNLISLPLSPFTSDGRPYDALSLSRDAGGAAIARMITTPLGTTRFSAYLPDMTQNYDLEPGAGYAVLSAREWTIQWTGRPWPASSTFLVVRPHRYMVGYPRGVPGTETAATLMQRLGVPFVAGSFVTERGDARLHIHLPGLTAPFPIRPGEGYLFSIVTKTNVELPSATSP